jgi:hypothetical protein
MGERKEFKMCLFLMPGIKANCKKVKIGGNYGRRK